LGADVLTGGAGADLFKITSSATGTAGSLHSGNLTIGGLGDNGTITAFDQITDLTTGTVAADKDTLDFSVAGILAAAASGDFTNSTLTVGGKAIATHTISATGLTTFTNTNGEAVVINSDAALAAVIQYLSGGDIGNAGATLIFNATYSAETRGSVTHTFAYQQTTTNAATTGAGDGYSLVDLVGVTLTGLETTASTTNNYMLIA
jgi:hypothetical protein